MCRNIKPLRLPDRQATEAEIAEAALQYVRKVSGYRKPSRPQPGGVCGSRRGGGRCHPQNAGQPAKLTEAGRDRR